MPQCQFCRIVFTRDPHEYYGKVLCEKCRAKRPLQCHECQSENNIELQLCRTCHLNRPFCRTCSNSRLGKLCIPQWKKLPPSVFAPLDFSKLVSTVAKCPFSSKKLPLYHGNQLTEFRYTEAEAVQHACVSFNALMELWQQLYGMTNAGIPSSQDTLCMALYAEPDRWILIITFNHYNLTHVPTPLRDHNTFRDMVLESDLVIIHNKNAGSHTLFEANSVATLDTFNVRVVNSNASPVLNGHRCLGAYPLDARNDHHAEMRAWAYGAKRRHRMIWMCPTRPCCEKCISTLTELQLLDLVPKCLRINIDSSSALRQVRQHVYENGDRVSFDDRNFIVRHVLADGDCLFNASGCGDGNPRQTPQQLRQATVAYQLASMPGVSQAHRDALVDPDNPTWGTVAEDLHALGMICNISFIVHAMSVTGDEVQRTLAGAVNGRERHLLHQFGHFEALDPVALREQNEEQKSNQHGARGY